MKKSFIAASIIALATFASCQKAEMPAQTEETRKGVEMTIGVTAPAMKATYDYELNAGVQALKFAWEIGDKISVVTYNASGHPLTNDIFTATSAGKCAEFSGTYTGTATGIEEGSGGSTANIIRLIYPALTNGWKSERSAGQRLNVPSLYLTEGSQYSNLSMSYLCQVADGDFSAVKDFNIMIGNLTSTANPTTTLTRLTNVLRLELNTANIPTGTTMYDVYVRHSRSVFVTNDWGYSLFLDFNNTSNNLQKRWSGGNSISWISMYLGANDGGSSYIFEGIQKEAGNDLLTVNMPAVAYGAWNIGDEVTIELRDKSSNTYTATTTLTKQYPMNTGGHILTLRATVKAPVANALSGKFSASSTKTVRFAKGNLWTNKTAVPQTWSFENSQYSMTPATTGYASDSHTTHFNWSETDFGTTYCTANSLPAGTWRTLTSAEWEWILGPRFTPTPGTNCRTTKTLNGVDNARFARAIVADVCGILVFPDNYSHPAGISMPSASSINAVDGPFATSYDTSAWAQLESAGVVFLPAAGSGNDIIYDVNNRGYYWSSTATDASNANAFFFYNADIQVVSERERSLGASVRLVTED